MALHVSLQAAFAAGLLIAAPASAQEAGLPDSPAPAADGSAQDLARKLANPVASLISVPFQENLDFGLGPDDDGFKSTLNVQPVVPIALSPDWNLIIRTILPLVYQNDVTGPATDQSGTGDVTQSFFFAPAKPTSGGLIWAIGPALLYPTATNHLLGGEKWGAGPTGLLLKQAGKNTFGILANHIWSIAGDDDRADVSSSFLQPFFSHTDASAVTYGVNTEASYDWKGENWVVPLNLSVTKLTRIGKQPVSFGGGFKYYVEKPEGGPDWGLRLVFTFLFPGGR